jgi:hypothetical protein
MKSKKPRTDALAEQMLAAGDSPRVTTIKLLFHACQLERELVAAQSRITELESVGVEVTPNESSSPTAGGGSGGAQPKGTNEK